MNYGLILDIRYCRADKFRSRPQELVVRSHLTAIVCAQTSSLITCISVLSSVPFASEEANFGRLRAFCGRCIDCAIYAYEVAGRCSWSFIMEVSVRLIGASARSGAALASSMMFSLSK